MRTPGEILMILTSHAAIGNTSQADGFRFEELATPYHAFVDAGAKVDIVSIDGGTVPNDPASPKPAGESEPTIDVSGEVSARRDGRLGTGRNLSSSQQTARLTPEAAMVETVSDAGACCGTHRAWAWHGSAGPADLRLERIAIPDLGVGEDRRRFTDAGERLLADPAKPRRRPETTVMRFFELPALLEELRNRRFSGKPLIRLTPSVN